MSALPRPLVVVVDGPSGSGKSTAARGVAQSLGLRYLDTGAMYRAVTWWMLSHGVDLEAPNEVAQRIPDVDVQVTTDPQNARVSVEGVDVTEAIRGRDVSNAVSTVSAIPEVRAAMVALQRRLIDGGGIVAEGRDLGTVVARSADLKVFLTAGSSARAQRRQAELTDGSVDVTHEELLQRDRQDSTRELSPLAKAADAVEIDSTSMTLEQVVDTIVSLAAQRFPGRAAPKAAR